MSDFLVNLARRGAGLPPIARAGGMTEAQPDRPAIADAVPIAIEEIGEPAQVRESLPAVEPARMADPVVSPPRPGAVEGGVPAPPMATPPAQRPRAVAQTPAPLVQRTPLPAMTAARSPAAGPGAAPREGAPLRTPGQLVDARREMVRAEPAPPPVTHHVARVPRRGAGATSPPPSSPERHPVRGTPDVEREASVVPAPAARDEAPPRRASGDLMTRETAREMPVQPVAVHVVEPRRLPPMFPLPVPAARDADGAPGTGVQVRIGAIELHAVAPPPVPPPPVTAPATDTADTSGFEAFLRLRRYGPWSR